LSAPDSLYIGNYFQLGVTHQQYRPAETKTALTKRLRSQAILIFSVFDFAIVAILIFDFLRAQKLFVLRLHQLARRKITLIRSC
jgi:hypothetical protein